MSTPLLHHAEKVAAEFEYSPEQVRNGVQEFLREMHEGLQKKGCTLSQIPTYVTAVPDGTEKGLYLAVDLGGTNFRVCSIHLHGNTTFSLIQSKVAIPRELMVAKTAKELFAFLAKQIELFLRTHHSKRFEAHIRRRLTMSAEDGYRDENIFQLGFTFSFPVEQIGINKGNLIRWTKGFDIEEAIGKDICALLQTEVDLLHLPVRVAALVNDTVGTLMARSYTSPGKAGTLIGAIFGTGTNGAYVEKLANVTKMVKERNYIKEHDNMIINTEWGSFDNHLSVLPNTPYDILLDKESVNPGIQMFEKRVSGMFLGEILRLALVKMLENPDIQLFADVDSSSNDYHSTTSIAPDSLLYQQWGIDTSFLSIVQDDNSVGFRVIRQALDKDLGISAASLEDAQAVKLLVTAIGKRAARLAAVALGAVVVNSRRLGKSSSGQHIPSTSTTKIAEKSQAGEFNAAATATLEVLQNTVAPLTDLASPEIPIEEEDIIDIGVDGSLVEFYPGFDDIIREALREIPEIGLAGERRIRIGIAKDGSGVGAALIALVAAKSGPPPKDSRGTYLGNERPPTFDENDDEQ
ncbi:MAG: glucokinase [Trizodia sp. TS-e1964]|nr:MAG: glucokinase [Trizodia sp. TS-e1964]